MKTDTTISLVFILLLGLLQSCSNPETDSPTPSSASSPGIKELADRYYAFTLQTRPETSYFSGVKIDQHDGISDNSFEGLAHIQDFEDEILLALQEFDLSDQIGTSDWITHAYLLQQIQSSVALRVCQTELWNVNQMGGWHAGYTKIAQLQPTGSASLRAESLSRWSKFSAFIDQEIVNLETGVGQGYSAPKTVVRRVINQVDGLLALDTERSPFYAPAKKDGEIEFRLATRKIIEEQIVPALRRYRDFLSDTYLDSAREALSVTANPNGRQCYQASLQRYTTLKRSGKDVFELGQKTVEANRKAVIELGKVAYGLDDFARILETARNDPADRFSSKQELLEFSRNTVKRAEASMSDWVGKMPSQPVEVIPFEDYEEGTGRSAHYNAGTVDRPGEYRIPLFEPEEQSRGVAERTAFHEAWPGHHLQVASAQAKAGLHPVTSILWFSGPGEGWARYSEALSEEMNLYKTKSGPILRRAWPARGMVVDPGIHLFNWTREQATAFLRESGGFSGPRADDMVDRIAILPGQLTAYDSGGLEIFALRKRAESALGSAFDIREFHDRILENGTIPLIQLREHIEAWIQKNSKGK